MSKSDERLASEVQSRSIARVIGQLMHNSELLGARALQMYMLAPDIEALTRASVANLEAAGRLILERDRNEQKGA